MATSGLALKKARKSRDGMTSPLDMHMHTLTQASKFLKVNKICSF